MGGFFVGGGLYADRNSEWSWVFKKTILFKKGVGK